MRSPTNREGRRALPCGNCFLDLAVLLKVRMWSPSLCISVQVYGFQGTVIKKVYIFFFFTGLGPIDAFGSIIE